MTKVKYTHAIGIEFEVDIFINYTTEFLKEKLYQYPMCWQLIKMENGAGFEIIDSDDRTLNALSFVVNYSSLRLPKRTSIKELSCQYQDPVSCDDSACTSCPLSSSPKCNATKRSENNCVFLPEAAGEKESHNESEVIADVQCAISYMYELYKEKEKNLQEENDIYIKNYLDQNSDIFSLSVLSYRYDRIEILVKHVSKIANEVSKLKSTLQKNVLNDFWKMHVDYHRSAVKFFSLAQSISEDIAEAVNCIKYIDELQLEDVKNMQLIGRKLITELYQSADIITEFKNCLDSSIKEENKT